MTLQGYPFLSSCSTPITSPSSFDELLEATTEMMTSITTDGTDATHQTKQQVLTVLQTIDSNPVLKQIIDECLTKVNVKNSSLTSVGNETPNMSSGKLYCASHLTINCIS